MIKLNIFQFLMVLISQASLLYTFEKLSNTKLKHSKLLLLIVLISSLIEANISHFINSPINGFISLIYFWVLCILFSKMKLKAIIFYLIIIWLMGILIDLSLMLILNILQNYIFFLPFNLSYIKPICTIVMSIIMILLSRSSKIKKLLSKAMRNYEKLNYSYINLFLILCLYFILGAMGIVNIQNKVMVPILTILAILFTLTIIKFVLNNYDILVLKETNDLLIKNNEFYLKLLEDYRILKHNLTSQLLGLKTVSNQKAKDLIDDLIKKYNDSFKTTNDMRNIPSGLTGIIYEKIYHFNHKELKVTVDNKVRNKVFDILSAHSYNMLCEAIGIILDNAMEAAVESKDKIIYLKFRESKESIKVTIMNTFSGTIDLEKLGTVNYTSKKKGHGLGLYSLIHRNRLQIKTSIKNNFFMNELLIEKTKN